MDGRCVCRSLVAGFVVLGLSATTGVTQAVAVGDRSESVTRARVSVDVVNAPLADVLDAIVKQAGLRRSWDVRMIDPVSRVTVRVKDLPVDGALAMALAGTGLRAVVAAGRVNIVPDGRTAPAAQGDIAGKIIDGTTKQGIRGAIITLDGTPKGITSGDNGGFRITNVVAGEHTLRVRMLGYVKATRSLTIIEGHAVSIEVALMPSISALDQVVVTGTVAPTAQKAIPNAMTVITAKDIERRGITHIDQLFRGDVPGLFVQNGGSGNPLDQVTMFSRGATSLGSVTLNGAYTNAIKTYIDGVELADPSYLSQIDPANIERIEIVTGPQASTIYGSNAINGVMQIFTKRGSASTRPQLLATFWSGLIQNNYRAGFTPQHDDAIQVSGTEGHVSYNAGGSWVYVGPWTPSKQTTRLSGFSGVRLQHGPLTVDASLRLATSTNRATGNVQQGVIDQIESGLDAVTAVTARGGVNEVWTLSGQTVGLTTDYAPFSWWSHEVVIGRDIASTNDQANPHHINRSDSLAILSQSENTRTSLRYVTTAHVPLLASTNATITVGADGWHDLTSFSSASSLALTGTLSGGYISVGRQPGHNAGGFLQGQVSILDALFLTYGLRAEWNPNYGPDAQPNLAPRYGMAYTRDLGAVTAKRRMSYGRSTRPPGVGEQAAVPAASISYIAPYVEAFGPFDYTLANPDLGPEFQQGGEGGLELYFGTRGSLVVTRYNQTVDNLIANLVADSVRSLLPYPNLDYTPVLDADGYAYYGQYQYLNVGSIRNQGWETQGTINLGPLTAKGTYSWTKSRVIGITPKYRAQITYIKPGAPFQYFPEHTWALAATYARGGDMLSITVNGISQLLSDFGPNVYRYFSSSIRLNANRLRMSYDNYVSVNPGYALADLNASHRFSRSIEGILQVQNLGNTYREDVGDAYASIGRQTKAGLRIRL